MKKLRYFSTFSGIGGMELGIEYAYEIYTRTKPKERTAFNGNSRKPEFKQKLNAGPICVGYSEIDKYATTIYQNRFPNHKNYGDITKIKAEELPDFDFLVGGFPCQSFSIAGQRKGFEDTRGTMFFELARILRAKSPRFFLFENVKGLLSHDDGKTFRTIIAALIELGYDLQWQVVNSKDFGVPQNRERVFIIGHLRGKPRPEVFSLRKNAEAFDQPATADKAQSQAQIASTIRTKEGTRSDDNFIIVNKKGEPKNKSIASTLTGGAHSGGNHSDMDLLIGTLRTHKDGQGFREIKKGISPTIPARAREDGSGQPILAYTLKARADSGIDEKHPQTLIVQRGRGHNKGGSHKIAPTLTGSRYEQNHSLGGVRRLTPTECERLQGFPDGWTVGVSDTQRYKCLGNAVTVNVVEAIVKELFI